MSKANDPAFPTAGLQNHEESLPVGGLTKREWFAGLAMQGIFASNPTDSTIALKDVERIVARVSVKAADFLIAELEKAK